MFNYFSMLYKQLSLYLSNLSYSINMTSNTRSSDKVQKKNKFKRCRPRSLLTRAFSPYTENETKMIKSTNYIITDEKRKSRLGKVTSYPYLPGIKQVENGHFCSFIREWFVVE